MDALMNHCGYSRERAALVLLRELQRSSGGSSTRSRTVQAIRPTDDEMFEVMKRYGLGMEEATKALIVSKAFQKELGSFGQTIRLDESVDAVRCAVDSLISRLSLDTILYESDSSADMNSDVEEEKLSIRPELRINPVSTSNSNTVSTHRKPSQQKSQKICKHFPTTTNPGKECASKNNIKATTVKSLNTSSSSSSSSFSLSTGRKRKMEEVTVSDQDDNPRRAKKTGSNVIAERTTPDQNHSTLSSRSKSDSVSSVVDAKISANTSAVTRPKRSHQSASTEKSNDPVSIPSSPSETLSAGNRPTVASSTNEPCQSST
ncbi:hypothetical protein IV203_030178 [Nitzschia inconspicua]|uniref:Uncharacterized protein n=1 Tax=Nitzschia inconspicua TaxID=303405 RepID=A0A9K3LST1_9STRA|nr:hypothetical protein IV203_030178 [Nitzschia inconspicua]